MQKKNKKSLDFQKEKIYTNAIQIKKKEKKHV